MATNNPSKFAAILIEKLNIVVKVEEIENQPPSSSNILETSFTDTGKIITSSSSQNTFKRPTVPMSNKEARVQRVSECCEFCKTKEKDDILKVTTFKSNNFIEHNYISNTNSNFKDVKLTTDDIRCFDIKGGGGI